MYEIYFTLVGRVQFTLVFINNKELVTKYISTTWTVNELQILY